MPGIYGYLKQNAAQNQIGRMQQALSPQPPLTHDPVFNDDLIQAARTHTGHIGPKSSPYRSGSAALWLEGECYNLVALQQQAGLSGGSFEELLLNAYSAGTLESILARADGYFAAALYDAARQKLYLITDRLGMRALYYYCKDSQFAWAGEIKQILELERIDKTIDLSTGPCFMDIGFLLEDHTWFEHIKLTHPASIYEFDIAARTLVHRRYWSWSLIRQQSIPFDDAVDAVCDLFPRAVARRFDPNENIGIALSGGLDSRALFATVNTLHPDYQGYVYTFGRQESEDVQIARQVTSLTKWRHQVFDLNADNWFEPRKNMVWTTEGMMSMMHMHGAEFLPRIAENIDIVMNGYLGDLVLGGGFITKYTADQHINPAIAAKFYKSQVPLARLDDPFYGLPHAEPHLYMNRNRRFTNVGTINTLPYIDHRKPFMDNDLLEFVFSIPDVYRKNNALYAAALLRLYPKYFATIPWQKTGRTIDRPMGWKLGRRIVNRLKKTLGQYRFYKDKKEFTNYQAWIREPQTAAALRALLRREGSEYSKYLQEDFTTLYLDPQLNARYIDNSDRILRAATVETYLRRVFR